MCKWQQTHHNAGLFFDVGVPVAATTVGLKGVASALAKSAAKNHLWVSMSYLK
jgi:hypothetical protein